MKAMTNKSEFFKVMSFGEFDYDFSLNLSEEEAKKLNFDVEQAKSIKDISPLLKSQDVCDKVQMSSQNKLINLLLFINKTNRHKTFIEFLSLNCIFLSNDLFFMKERIKSNFDEDFMYLLESNVLPPTKYKFNINVENKAPKTFEMEFFMTDTKKESEKENPKSGNHQEVNKIILPNASRPNFLKESSSPQPEGKEDKMPPIDPSQINKNQQSPLILSKKRAANTPQDNSTEQHNILSTYPKLNLSEQLKYDFESCDYLLLDLNQFVLSKNVNLNELHNFLVTRIINNYYNTSIIMVFPRLDNIQRENYQVLIDLITIADIMIYDKRDATKMCTLMGYKVEEKNFEVRFMFLKELKKAKYKPHRTAMFMDDFNKLTIIVQETETNLVVFHNEFNFNLGFKADYYQTVTDNYDILKHVFLGGLLSRIIQNKPFDIAFEAGSQVFAKMLEALKNKINYTDNPDYFLVELNKERQLEEAELDPQLSKSMNNRYRNKSSSSKERKFVLDSTNILNSKLPSYNALKDTNLKNYFQSSSVQKQLGKMSMNSAKKSLNSNSRSQLNQLEFIQQEQNKFLTILEQNQLLQKKLVSLLSVKETKSNQASLNNSSSINPLSQSLNQNSSMSNDLIYSKGNLAKLDNNNTNPFNKLGNSADFMNLNYDKIKKKPLKPITKEAYDRLTGANKKDKSYGVGMSSMMNPQMMMMFMMMQNQMMQKNSDKKEENKTDEKKTEEKKNEEKKTEGKTGENKASANSTFTPEFIQQYSEMMKMMGMNLGGVTQQAPKKKSNYKGKSYFDKKHGGSSGYDYLSEDMSKMYQPHNAGFNPNQSIELNKSPSKSPRRSASRSKSPEKEIPKVEEKKFEGKGKPFIVDDKKPQEQITYEAEYKKKMEEKQKKDEETRKKKIEDERREKEVADRKKKELQDSARNQEDERIRKDAEEKIKKGKDIEQPDIKKTEPKK